MKTRKTPRDRMRAEEQGSTSSGRMPKKLVRTSDGVKLFLESHPWDLSPVLREFPADSDSPLELSISGNSLRILVSAYTHEVVPTDLQILSDALTLADQLQLQGMKSQMMDQIRQIAYPDSECSTGSEPDRSEALSDNSPRAADMYEEETRTCLWEDHCEDVEFAQYADSLVKKGAEKFHGVSVEQFYSCPTIRYRPVVAPRNRTWFPFGLFRGKKRT